MSRICEITINKNVDTLRVESSEMVTKLLNSGSLNTLSHIKSLDLCWVPWEELGAEGSQAEGMWVKTRNSYSEEAKVKEIPDGIKDFQSLEELNIKGNRLESFNDGILELKNLKKLIISSNSISQLPDLSSLSNLEYLDCSSNGLLEIPESVFSLLKLKTLDFGYNHNIKSISHKINKLQHLESVNIYGNDIEVLPPKFSQLKNLLLLNVSGNPLKNHLEIIAKLPTLKSLDISYNRGEPISIPESMGELKSLDYLDISGCNIVEIPASIGELKNLEYLNLTNSKIESVDPAIGKLTKLVALNFASNWDLNAIPETIGNLENLETLNLNGCKNLSTIPETIGDLQKLEVLNLYDCKNITEISDNLSKLKQLKTIELSYTQIEKIDFVYEMTQLENLKLFDTKVVELNSKIKQKLEIEKSIILPSVISVFFVSIVGSYLIINNYKIGLDYYYLLTLSTLVILTKLVFNLSRMMSKFIFSQLSLNFWKIGLFLITLYLVFFEIKIKILDLFQYVLFLFFYLPEIIKYWAKRIFFL